MGSVDSQNAHVRAAHPRLPAFMYLEHAEEPQFHRAAVRPARMATAVASWAGSIGLAACC